LIIDEIRLLLMILVKFQPDIPILMVMGGILTRYGPPNWGTGEKQLKRGKMMTLNFRPPNPEIIMVNPQRKLYGLCTW
jgi:hypothetical protein